ncbi:DUF1707 domain-containing protein, partial [Nonomuraea thailandensis]
MTSDDDDFEFAFPRSWTGHRPRAHRPWTGRDGHAVRVGDAERDAVAAALREHYAQGRLTGEDLDERLAAVLTARYAEDLHRVTADLPGPAMPGPPTGPTGPTGPGGPAGAGRKQRHDRLAPWLILAIVVAALLGGRNHYHGSLFVFLLVAAGIAVVAGAV